MKSIKEKKRASLNFLFLFFYRWLVVPFGLAGIFTLGLFSSQKIRKSFHLRTKLAQQKKPFWQGKTSPIWIHAASGEFEYAKGVIRQLKLKFPKIPILVTYFSPTYVNHIQSFKEVDWCEPLPLDTFSATRSFLKNWNPKCLLIARTDFWPELLTQCRLNSIPTFLFSATFSEKKISSFIKLFWLRFILPLLSEVHVVSSEDQLTFNKIIKNNNCYVTGDTRYDQVMFRLSQTHPSLKHSIFISSADQLPILVAGSTWEEDEDILLSAIGPFIKAGQIRLIIVPHEPTKEHLSRLQKMISQKNLQKVNYSQIDKWEKNEILIIDQVGLLASLYSFGSLAFVGGSFRGSVHSVMEALACGAITFVGPHYCNNREAIIYKDIPTMNETLNENFNFNMVEVVSSAEQWRNRIEQWLHLSKDLQNSMQKKISSTMKSQTGSSQKLVDHLFNYFAASVDN